MWTNRHGHTRKGPIDDQQADRLGDFADAWVDGQLAPPESDLEETFARVQRVMGGVVASRPPASHSLTTNQQQPGKEISMQQSIAVSTIPAISSARSGVPRSRWQPAASVALMIALLLGMVAIAYEGSQRGSNPEPTMMSAFVQDATPEAEDCAPPRPSASDDELQNATLSDWNSPVYFARDYADEQTAREVRSAFTSYLRCAAAIGYFTDDEQAFNPEIRDYFSPRTRYLSLYDDLTTEQQTAIDTFSCRPREESVLRDFPILVNNQLLPVPMSGENPHSIYDAYDVFLLGDGRYGMATGRITTESLRNPSAPVGRDALGIVTLIEQDDDFYIDEFFVVVSVDPSLYSYGQMSGDCD